MRIVKMAAVGAMAVTMMATGLIRAQGATVLKSEDMQKLLPASVYYRGQPAVTQVRNSGGVKFADGYYVLATLVDTTGYSTAVAAKYQAYFIAEVPITVGGKKLGAGVYGAGFVEGKFVITDVGAHDLLSVPSSENPALQRPMPLQVVADPKEGFRLYAGRKFVSFSR
jgi:hypothetical protein